MAQSDEPTGNQCWPRIAQRELKYLGFRAQYDRTTEESMRANPKNLDIGTRAG
jgi:hypothetical protein